MTNTSYDTRTGATGVDTKDTRSTARFEANDVDRRISNETKPSFKTTELIAYVVAVIGVLVASAVSDGSSDFGPQAAWFLVTLLTIGYMVSRGLAKSGSRNFFDQGDSTS